MLAVFKQNTFAGKKFFFYHKSSAERYTANFF